MYRNNLEFRNNLVAFILTLACFVVLIPNLGSAQADEVKNSMAALKAETGKLGAPAVQSNELHFGKSKVSAELVDAVVKKHGGAATLFVNNGDQYVRVCHHGQKGGRHQRGRNRLGHK